VWELSGYQGVSLFPVIDFWESPAVSGEITYFLKNPSQVLD
jgi:hypothetical protein